MICTRVVGTESGCASCARTMRDRIIGGVADGIADGIGGLAYVLALKEEKKL